ncbi:MAG: 3-phosphoserine/phosphohydroxythreonine transaminase [Gammaproteobacteria bacterium]|nr:3-phosphoserine/phosphohydroxythreonine transaminase [Gammaproteobacteria bacterium]
MKSLRMALKVATTPIYNFSPGPAMLPREVMQKVREEFLDWHGLGMSIAEMSHRSRAFTGIAEQSVRDLSELLGIPENYRILFLQGGATHVMSMAPLNLCGETDCADYVITGNWSKRAAGEAGRLTNVNIAASSADVNHTTIPGREGWRCSEKPAYLYFCDNETIAGVEFPSVPVLPDSCGDTVLVSDMTSNFLSRPVQVDRYGLIFAGAQKNFAPAGLTIALVREDLLGRARPDVPFLYDFRLLAEHGSMFNTPPVFNWYVAGLTFAWIRQQGGVERMHENALRRSGKLYDFIDANDFYSNPVEKPYRSRMNVPFVLADADLDRTFLDAAADNGLVELKGHRSVGGMRASMYNGMPEAGVDTLIEFMEHFASRYG